MDNGIRCVAMEVTESDVSVVSVGIADFIILVYIVVKAISEGGVQALHHVHLYYGAVMHMRTPIRVFVCKQTLYVLCSSNLQELTQTPPIYVRLTHYRETNPHCSVIISSQFSRGTPWDI